MLSRHSTSVALIVAFSGIGACIAAFVWESLGAIPCLLCKVERLVFLAAGVSALLSLLGARKIFLWLSALFWFGASGVLFTHMGIQLGWFPLPQVCRVDIPLTSAEAIEKALLAKPQVSCDTIEFTLFGLPPTFYLLGFALVMLSACLWAVRQLRRKKG